MDKKATDSLTNKLFDKSDDLIMDLAEVTLDQFIKGQVLKEIPAIKTMLTAIKIGKGVREWSFVNKLSVFIKTVQSGKINKENLEREKARFLENPDRKRKTMEMILLMIDRILEEKKARILANFYLALLNEKIDFKRFLSLCSVLDGFQLLGIETMRKISQLDPPFRGKSGTLKDETSQFDGLAILFSAGLALRIGAGSSWIITPFGQDFYNYGIAPLPKTRVKKDG